MVRGLYTAYTGLVNQQRRLDIVSNNLANATTTGYKKEGVTTQSFDSISSSNPERRLPPPVRTIPLSAISDASSGGVFSNTL